MNITKITIGRLYNLGNYEHIRYELTVDVNDGESATAAVIGMEKILAGLTPLQNQHIKSPAELERLKSEVESMKLMPLAQFQIQYGSYTGSPQEVIDYHAQRLAEETAKTKSALERAVKARSLFDDLGGATTWKDAKLDWEDYNDDNDR